MPAVDTSKGTVPKATDPNDKSENKAPDTLVEAQAKVGETPAPALTTDKPADDKSADADDAKEEPKEEKVADAKTVSALEKAAAANVATGGARAVTPRPRLGSARQH